MPDLNPYRSDAISEYEWTRQSSKLRKLDEDYRDFIEPIRFHRKRTTRLTWNYSKPNTEIRSVKTKETIPVIINQQSKWNITRDESVHQCRIPYTRSELLIHLYFLTYRPVLTRLFIGNCLFGKVKLQFRFVIGPGSGTVSIIPILVGLLFSKMSVKPIPIP